MKVKTLLSKAAQCETDGDAENLLGILERVFGNARSLSHLPIMNSDACMEEDAPFVRFELNKEISDYFITMIRPEIRDGKFSITIATNRMLDGMGMQSQEWEVEEGMEEIIEPTGDQTIASLAKQAKAVAIANHAQLIERVGVADSLALKTAEKSW